MKCPTCQRHTCSFAEWLTSGKGFENPACSNCAQLLRVSFRTRVAIALAIALGLIALYVVVIWAGRSGVTLNFKERRWGVYVMAFAALFPPVGLLGFIEWRTGTHRKR